MQLCESVFLVGLVFFLEVLGCGNTFFFFFFTETFKLFGEGFCHIVQYNDLGYLQSSSFKIPFSELINDLVDAA